MWLLQHILLGQSQLLKVCGAGYVKPDGEACVEVARGLFAGARGVAVAGGAGGVPTGGDEQIPAAAGRFANVGGRCRDVPEADLVSYAAWHLHSQFTVAC